MQPVKKSKWSLFVFGVYAMVVLITAGIVIFAHGLTEYYLKEETGGYLLSNVQLALLGAVLCALFVLCARKGKDARIEAGLRRLGWKLPAILSLLTMVMQAFVCYHTYFISVWDTQTVTESAYAFARGEYEYFSVAYFSVYPNNLTLTALYGYILRAVMALLHNEPGMERFMVMLILMQSAINVSVGAMIWGLTRELLGEKGKAPYLGALCAWLLYFVLIGCSPWYLMPYSDSTALWIPILMVLIYLSRRSRRGVSEGLIIGLLGGLAFLLKPQAMIPAIAIALNEGAKAVEGRNRKQVLAYLCMLVLGAAVVVGPVKSAIVGSMDVQLDEERRLGIAHFFCMGLNEEWDGQWNRSEENAALAYPTNEERDAFEMQLAAERIRNFGVLGLAEHAVKKCLVNFSDGSFTWKGLMNLRRLMEEKDPVITPLLRSIVYEDGEYYPILHTIQQFAWLLVLMLCAAGTCMPGRMMDDGADALNVLMLCMVGIICFNMLFEARGRYVYIMVPVIIPLAAYVLSALGERAAAGQKDLYHKGP